MLEGLQKGFLYKFGGIAVIVHRKIIVFSRSISENFVYQRHPGGWGWTTLVYKEGAHNTSLDHISNVLRDVHQKKKSNVLRDCQCRRITLFELEP